jgi:hypothetical protein
MDEAQRDIGTESTQLEWLSCRDGKSVNHYTKVFQGLKCTDISREHHAIGCNIGESYSAVIKKLGLVCERSDGKVPAKSLIQSYSHKTWT